MSLDRTAPWVGAAGEERSVAHGGGLFVLELGRRNVGRAAPELAALVSVPCVTVAVHRGPGRPPPADEIPADVLVARSAHGGDGWVEHPSGVDGALAAVAAGFDHSPQASVVLVQLLRANARLLAGDPAPEVAGEGVADGVVADGLVAESFGYSLLLAGPEFARWLAARPRRRVADGHGAPPAVLVRRRPGPAGAGDELHLTLNRPEVRNAYNTAMRDGLAAALDVAAADATISQVLIDGAGEAFCSGGDLNEFGTSSDPVSAHLVRTTRRPAASMSHLRARLTASVHGACVGAGVELSAFAGCVVADRSATFRLPEVRMGLLPGAGGTVSLPRRIGRQRTAYLALGGETIDAATAASWGLVDEIRDGGRVDRDRRAGPITDYRTDSSRR